MDDHSSKCHPSCVAVLQHGEHLKPKKNRQAVGAVGALDCFLRSGYLRPAGFCFRPKVISLGCFKLHAPMYPIIVAHCSHKHELIMSSPATTDYLTHAYQFFTMIKPVIQHFQPLATVIKHQSVPLINQCIIHY